LREKFLYHSVFPLFCVTQFPFQSLMDCKETQYKTVIPNPPFRALSRPKNPYCREANSTILSAIIPKGLYYVGLSWQRSFSSATIRGVGADAKYVVKHLNRLLKE
jgi:hypothetical protein